MTPARFRWGMLLVLLGVALLLRNIDAINNNFWADFLTYLPVVLIAIGIEKIFTKTRAQAVAYATTVFLFLGGLYVVYAGSRGGETESFFSQTSYTKEYDPTVKQLRATLDLAHANLMVRDATGNLIDGQFREFSEKPEISFQVQGSDALVTMTSKARRWLGGLIKVQTGDNDWYLSFCDSVPLVLECNGDESQIHLNLSTTPVQHVKITDDKGEIYLKLGTLTPEVNVDLAGDEADVRLRVPTDAGLQVTGMDDEEYLRQLGLSRRNGAFVNQRYDSVSNRINVKLDDRLTSLNIDYY